MQQMSLALTLGLLVFLGCKLVGKETAGVQAKVNGLLFLTQCCVKLNYLDLIQMVVTAMLQTINS